MKIKKFIAADMSEAMQQVRSTLGADAVILENMMIDGEVHLTAALDETSDFEFDNAGKITGINVQERFDERHLRECLTYHGTVETVSQKILAACRLEAQSCGYGDEQKVLSQALSTQFRFENLFGSSHKVKIFMGTQGSGKSTAIAKMATQAKIKGIKTAIVSTDNVRAGANKQLQAFAEILGVDFKFEKTARALFDYVKDAETQYGMIFIDTPGINPYYEKEQDKVLSFADAVKGDKFLIMDAGRNVLEAVESAEIFLDLGVKYLLPTRLDLTRRIGAVLSAAHICGLTLCAASVNASIANGLAAVDKKSLARLILS